MNESVDVNAGIIFLIIGLYIYIGIAGLITWWFIDDRDFLDDEDDEQEMKKQKGEGE